ncbi:MAG: hypothetical protein LBR76_03450 [Oscillospiraceae bacterium]|jgi:uncharacterized surface anchored protein|nr:hypothetical protein [Oscillospiraceae bacterium]
MRKLTALLLTAIMLFGTIAAPVTVLAAGSAENYPLNSIVIKVEDIVTHSMLGGARFEIYYSNDAMSGGYGTLVATVDSDGSGVIVLSGIPSGYYIVRQTMPPNNYHLSINNEQHCLIKPDGTSIEELVFSNYRYGGLVVLLTDKDTNEPVPGATFSVTDTNGGAVGTSADGIYTTDARGEFFLENLPAGSYKITQLTAAQGYAMDSQPNTRTVRLQHTSADNNVFTAAFSNSPLGTLVVRLKDSVSKQPLSGAVFNVKLSGGADLGEFTTGANGSFTLPKIARGSYVISQVSAPSGYLIASGTKTQYVDYINTYAVDFENQPKSGLYVTKYDADTKEPLKDAKFRVYQGDTLYGEYTTNEDGVFMVANLQPGWYTVSEYAAPHGYILDDTPKSVEVIAETLHRLEFENSRLASLQIIKTDEFNGEPLAGARFRVTTQNGEFVGDVSTDGNGKAIIPSIEPGWYVISETKAPVGYLITEAARTVEVKATVPTVVTITNRAENNLEIIKLDFFSRVPLPGATFRVERANGEFIGTYRTDSAGKILVGNLSEGAYVVSEVSAPDGYQLDSEPQTVVIEGGRLHSVEFLDKPLAGLQIKKIDSHTRQPIAGVSFAVSKMNGERLGEYTTGRDGLIYLPALEPGWYTVTETKAANGYIIDAEPRNVEIKWGESETLVVENTAMGGLLIVKTDEATGKPLAGVVFDIKGADGQLMTGLIADGNQPGTLANSPNGTAGTNGGVPGSYTTDTQGRIQLNTLPAGEYLVTERKALDGYELDATVRSVTVTPGKLAALQITNRQKAGLRLLKIDSVTKKPIFGVEFMVFDANNKVVGTYVTDNNGVIDFGGILSEGRYTIRETRAAAGYYRDDMPRTVEFKSGRVTEVVWENTPQLGQIQIMTLSGDDNQVNGLPKGTPLAGAVFEIYQYKSGNLVDRFVSGADGRAVSKPLPLGRYTVREVQAPPYYRLSAETLDIELEFATQIIKRDFLNYPANTGVKIRNTGNYEAMPGDTIRYDIKEVANTSSVPLTDFYWRNTLPANAVRLNKIVTGTYNQSLKYKILITTNKGDTRIIADNLSTTVNNVIDCRNAALGIANDEFVTSFTFIFGTVKAGFCQVLTPQVYATVNKGLQNGFDFANKADIGGKYGSEWVIGNAVWVTKIYTIPGKLPRTGY